MSAVVALCTFVCQGGRWSRSLTPKFADDAKYIDNRVYSLNTYTLFPPHARFPPTWVNAFPGYYRHRAFSTHMSSCQRTPDGRIAVATYCCSSCNFVDSRNFVPLYFCLVGMSSGLMHLLFETILEQLVLNCWLRAGMLDLFKSLRFVVNVSANMIAVTNVAICINLALIVYVSGSSLSIIHMCTSHHEKKRNLPSSLNPYNTTVWAFHVFEPFLY